MLTVYNIGPMHAEVPNARNVAHVLANAKTINRSSCPTTTSLNIEAEEIKKWAAERSHYKYASLGTKCYGRSIALYISHTDITF